MLNVILFTSYLNNTNSQLFYVSSYFRPGPSHIPTITYSTETSFTSLSFSWDAAPCGQVNGDGLVYEYQLRNNDNIVVDSRQTYTTSMQFNNLLECATYSFRVRSSNSVGDGTWSSYAFATTRTIIGKKIGAVNV